MIKIFFQRFKYNDKGKYNWYYFIWVQVLQIIEKEKEGFQYYLFQNVKVVLVKESNEVQRMSNMKGGKTLYGL